MATTRIKDLSKTATTVASDANIVIDGSSNGTQKITRDNFRQDTADAYVAAPSTYKLAPLNGVNKIDGTYLPTSGDTPKGEWNASTNSPTLADGTGTAGDYYDVTTAGTANLGSGAITYTVGDVVKYNGATWFKIDSVANILDGISTVDPAKVALQIPNVGTAANEVPVNGMLGDLAFQSSAAVTVDDLTVDGHFSGTVGKPMPVNGPTMRFDGVDDHVAFAAPVGSAFSFTSSTDDTPFSASFWVKMNDLNTNGLLAKYGSSTSLQEWGIATNSVGKLQFIVKDSSGGYHQINSDNALNQYLGKWVFITATYAGAGPNSSNSFAFANVGMQFYINAQAIAVSNTSSNYGGMSSTNQAVTLGRYFSTAYTLDGEIRDVKLFNKALSAAEVKEVYSNGQLPNSFSESTGAIAYTSDFSSGVDGWTANNGTINGNIDSIGGRDDNLRFTSGTTSGTHYPIKDNVMTAGKKYRVSAEVYIPSGQSHIDGIIIYEYSPVLTPLIDKSNIALDTWVTLTAETDPSLGNTSLRFYATDAGSVTFQDAAGDDVMYVRNVRITQIGSVLDARAEQFDTSTGKLYDLSGNSFVGTQSGGVSLLGRKFPVYETGTWTPSITFGGGSTGIAYSYQEGVYTRTGDVVHASCIFQLSNKGSDTGDAVITGLPFLAKSASSDIFVAAFGRCANLSGLTSGIEGAILNGTSTIRLNDVGATGSSNLNNTHFTNSSILRFSATYQIQ